MLNTLPSPRSVAAMFEQGTTFEYNIGNGDSICGSVQGLDTPVYIDWDSEDPTYYAVHYDSRTSEEMLQQMANLDLQELVNDSRKFIKLAYSIDEVKAILNTLLTQ